MTTFETRQPARSRDRLPAIASAIALAFVAVLVVRYQIYLLDYVEWGDESETIVAAKMMASGLSLYSEIFNHHGPLTFLTGYLLERFGSFGVQSHRIPIAVLQWVALGAIYFSPLLADRAVRNLYVAVAASVMVIYLPEMNGHMYQYQTIAGLLLVIIMAQYTLPAIACPDRVGPKRIAAGNMLIASLPFLAITYLPLVALLFAASVRRSFLVRAVAFLAAGAAVNLLFIAVAGSIPGFLAFHLYLNSSVLTVYVGGLDPVQVLGNIYAALTQSLGGFAALAVLVAALASLASRNEGLPWRPVLLGLALASLLIRGGHAMHHVPFYYACLTLPMVLLGRAKGLSWQSTAVALVLVVACAARLSLLAPMDMQRIVGRPIPPATEFSQLARAVTHEGDRIISYTFQNYEYIAADRLPASGHFFYLPWQEKYNENPRFGIRIDACGQIRSSRPKAMLLDKWVVYGLYPWESYAQCVQSFVDQNYYQVSGRPFYLRNDISPRDIGVAGPNEAFTVGTSKPLAPESPIALSMTDAQREEAAALRAIGILVGTHGRRNAGEARLELMNAEGRAQSIPFGLADLADNRYRFFEVPPGKYTSGQIVSIAGGGVSVRESSRAGEPARTCLIYDYANGKRRFTPGCPLW